MKIMAEVTVEMCDDDDNTDEEIEDGHNVCQLLEEEGDTSTKVAYYDKWWKCCDQAVGWDSGT